LANSIPLSKTIELKNYYEKELMLLSSLDNNIIKSKNYAELKWEYFIKFDEALDSNSDRPQWLKEVQIANIVSEALKYLDGKSYKLISYSIMPNHVHLIIKPFLKIPDSESLYKQTYPLGSIMSSIKRYTAGRSNEVIKAQGKFWQPENYDHIIRNSEELNLIIKYVLDNPYKAKLIDYDKNYEWNYFNPASL
jgi:REP element-mobilizing transposase RayT